MTLKSSRPPIHANPPILGAIPTAMGWRHPQTNELLVSVRGLLDLHDNGAAPSPAVIQSTVSSQAGDASGPGVVVNSSTASSLPEGTLDAEKGPTAEGGATKDAETSSPDPTTGDSEVKQDDAGEKQEPPAPVVDNSLFKFEKTGDDAVVKVTLRAPNHHAYTKWVVDGVDVEGARGNTVDIKVGALFTANNAKGSFSGQAIAAE